MRSLRARASRASSRAQPPASPPSAPPSSPAASSGPLRPLGGQCPRTTPAWKLQTSGGPRYRSTSRRLPTSADCDASSGALARRPRRPCLPCRPYRPCRPWRGAARRHPTRKAASLGRAGLLRRAVSPLEATCPELACPEAAPFAELVPHEGRRCLLPRRRRRQHWCWR